MSVATADLDQMQAAYKTAVEEWISAIREEEALASVDHSTAKIDSWEAAGLHEEDARHRAKQAKKDYEAALREQIFQF
jgi:hypothetical protein